MDMVKEKTKTRRWTPEEKKDIIEQTYQPGMSVSIIARKYGIFPSQLFYGGSTWKMGLSRV
jgi:transposase